MGGTHSKSLAQAAAERRQNNEDLQIFSIRQHAVCIIFSIKY